MRAFAFMLAHNRAEMVRGALENIEATTTDAEHRRLVKTLVLCQYPLPSVEENRAELTKLAAEFGWWLAEIPNRSVVQNWNVCIHDIAHMQEGDFLICADPDVRWQQKGWLSAGIEALRSDPAAVFCCAARRYHNDAWCEEQHGRSIHQLPSGLRIARYRQLIAWSTGIWKGEWLAARPKDFKEPNAIYGYGEHADLALMQKHGKTWLSLVDFYDEHQDSEPLYTRWKAESAAARTRLPFAQWLATASRA